MGGVRVEHSTVRERERKRPGEKRACEGPGGSSKRRPLRTKRLLAQCAWGPCDPNQTLETKQYRTKRGPTLRPQRAPPSPHSGKGAGEITRFSPLRQDHLLGLLENVWPQNKTKGEKQKPRTRSQETPLPPRVQKGASEGASELKPREFQENPRNARGQNGTPKQRHEAGRTANPGDTPHAAGQKRTRTTNTGACGGCPVTT